MAKSTKTQWFRCNAYGW